MKQWKKDLVKRVGELMGVKYAKRVKRGLKQAKKDGITNEKEIALNHYMSFHDAGKTSNETTNFWVEVYEAVTTPS